MAKLFPNKKYIIKIIDLKKKIKHFKFTLFVIL